MENVELLSGEIFKDARGQISSLNNFHFEGVQRMYIVHHPDCSTIRGWNGHQFERKWFYCVKGSFEVRLVKVDDWQNPSPTLSATCHRLSEGESQLLCVPGGYANRLQALEPDAILLVLSDKSLAESAADSYRFDPTLWSIKE